MAKVNLGLTVNDLLEACKAQVKAGRGNRHVLISDDDEGNGFHTLFYLFSSPTSDFLELEHDGTHTVDNSIILG